MKEFFLWWVGIEAVGLAAFPLTYAFFRRLPDRGFAFSKVIGLLLLGYGVWAGAVAGLFPNSRGSVILVLLLIAGLSALVAGRHREELTGFLRSGWRYMAFVEVLFFAVLAGAVFIRSFAPDIVWGEKLFELAFLNSIHRSEFFPPNDPWLSGHSISYYYFGYVMISALSKLVALGTNVTFYLALSLMAALASVTAFGLVYNMIAASRRRREPAAAEGPALVPRAAVFGLAAAGLMLVVSNLVGIFELMARHGVGSGGFYGLVNIEGLDGTYDCGETPANCSQWYPTPFWWWWKATRMGSPWDVQEFPFFSFQFGDLHPHVILMPFLITAFAVAFQVILMARGRGADEGGKVAETPSGVWPLRHPWLVLLGGLLVGGAVLAGAIVADVALFLTIPLAFLAAIGLVVLGALADSRAGEEDEAESLDALWWLRHPAAFILIALMLGGIAFIDTWGVAASLLLLLVAVGVVNWLRTGGDILRAPLDTAGFAVPVMAAAYFFYLPFYMDLVTPVEGPNITQASTTPGYPPNDSESTRPLHFLLFWLPILWIGLSFIVAYVWARRREVFGRLPLGLASLLWAVPVGGWVVWILVRSGFGGLADELAEREASLITVLMLAVFITVVGVAFLHQLRRPAQEQDRGQLFTFQLAGFAFLMMLGAEFFFVDDLFGWRVNTVFRFWHQGWIILSIVGGFGLYRLTLNWRLPELRPGEVPWQRLAALGIAFGAGYTLLVALDPWEVLYAKWWTATLGIFVAGASVIGLAVAAAVRVAPAAAWQRLSWLGATVVVLSAALVYPVAVTFERTNGFRSPQSLDGLAYVQRGNPTEYEAIEWLNRNITGTPVVLEAFGTDYSDFGRVSARTGLPTVMGWLGHELQWRGYGTFTTGALVETSLTEIPGEVATIYNTTDVEQARVLMDKYDVEYVYVGWLEREEYDEAGLAKFGEFMIPVFENEAVTIYRTPVPGAAVAPPE